MSIGLVGLVFGFPLCPCFYCGVCSGTVFPSFVFCVLLIPSYSSFFSASLSASLSLCSSLCTVLCLRSTSWCQYFQFRVLPANCLQLCSHFPHYLLCIYVRVSLCSVLRRPSRLCAFTVSSQRLSFSCSQFSYCMASYVPVNKDLPLSSSPCV